MAKRPQPTPDGIITAQLHGAASRRARWSEPTGQDREDALAELRDIADGRTDLLAQVAGTILGWHPPSDMDHEHFVIAAGLLLEAGGAEHPDVKDAARTDAEERRKRPARRDLT